MSSHPDRPVALVTGGARGIGRAVVEALAREGWRVHFSALTTDSVGRALAELSRDFGDQVSGQAVDVRDSAAVAAHVASVLEAAGRLDLLVNNAGLGYFASVDELEPEDWRRVLATNLDGPFFYLHAAARHMKERGSGWIINVASLAARSGFAGGAAYNASKFGLLGLTEAAMLDLRRFGVRVAAVLPGSVSTEFAHPAPGGGDWKLQPADVAEAILDLLRFPPRALPSLIELRPSRPPAKG
ncbi:MAG TPA: SDR family oxidoreductase [Thermoanaerobaculia bacterium]|nr:SDR family oxidoreductase [Thermoanaerobaculia bacterium]